MNTIDKQDELIFDFLEGNLSPDEEEAFLILKEESEVLGRQVRLWQNTYLKEPLPSVEALEKKLFIHDEGHSRNFSSRIYAILMIALTYIVAPGDHVQRYIQGPLAEIANENVVAIPESAFDPLNTGPDCSGKKYKDSAQASITRQHEAPSAEYHSAESRPLVLSDLKTEAVFELQQIALEKIRIRVTKTHTPGSFKARKKWSRREQRLIRKKLWQEDKTRDINMFLNGNEPYVVPLNTNNF
jgi:hypothetical protein